MIRVIIEDTETFECAMPETVESLEVLCNRIADATKHWVAGHNPCVMIEECVGSENN